MSSVSLINGHIDDDLPRMTPQEAIEFIMTDAKIIKGLECCTNSHLYNCDDCPFHKKFESGEDVLRYALDLINRQKAEIERLSKDLEEAAVSIHDAANRYSEYKKLMQCQKEEIERLQSILLKFIREINIFENKHNIDTSDFSLIPILENEKNSIVKQIRTEAIKEFAERLKDHSRKMQSSDFSGEFWDRAVLVSDIDKVVKEKAGDTK